MEMTLCEPVSALALHRDPALLLCPLWHVQGSGEAGAGVCGAEGTCTDAEGVQH